MEIRHSQMFEFWFFLLDAVVSVSDSLQGPRATHVATELVAILNVSNMIVVKSCCCMFVVNFLFFFFTLSSLAFFYFCCYLTFSPFFSLFFPCRTSSSQQVRAWLCCDPSPPLPASCYLSPPRTKPLISTSARRRRPLQSGAL